MIEVSIWERWNSLEAALDALFPAGTTKEFLPGTAQDRCGKMPLWPPDLFAAAAYLLDRGGVYHRIIPEAKPYPGVAATHEPPFTWGPADLEIGLQKAQAWKQLGDRWRVGLREGNPNLDRCKEEISVYWNALIANITSPIVRRPTADEIKNGWYPKRLVWWEPAVALLAIADEACLGLGYVGESGLHWCETQLRETIYAEDQLFIAITSNHKLYRTRINSFQHAVHRDVIRVVPKSQTPFVGCTMRTLSHNLALVPPQGVVDISWCRDSEKHVSERGPLNVLLIPFPYVIPATSFVAVSEVPETPPRPAKPWGWFRIDQKWLVGPKTEEQSGNVVEFIHKLVIAAEKDCGFVHGVILPEAALNWPIYSELVERLRESNVEFLISGSSSSPDLYRPGQDSIETGNFALTTTFTSAIGEGGAPPVREAYTHSRSKHHRWQLNSAQIAGYGLGSALDPSRIWWEGTALPRREVGITTFRSNSTFATMICEDLARSDPVHEPLRAIGPNLVFVLLLDGAQLPYRWPARYSLSLSDDPGSSILTLTSLGLIERSNATGIHKDKSRSIAIWKDASLSSVICIECPSDAQGALLTVTCEPTTEATLDGRADGHGKSWRYSGNRCERGTWIEMMRAGKL